MHTQSRGREEKKIRFTRFPYPFSSNSENDYGLDLILKIACWLSYSLFEHQFDRQVSLWLWKLNQTKSKRTEISCSLRKSPPNQNQIKSIDSPNIYVELRAVEKRFFSRTHLSNLFIFDKRDRDHKIEIE